MYVLILSNSLSSQNVYQWLEKKISINSPEKLTIITSEGSLILSGSGINVDISSLNGMEGISGLTGSLDSYAKSFYSNVGNASEIQLKNLNAAKSTAQKDGKSVVLVMFATSDYSQHFVCEIVFDTNKKTIAEAILKSIAYNDTGQIDENISNDDVNNLDVVENEAEISVGTFPPNFKLLDKDNSAFELNSLKGKMVLLDFWGTWCAPCIKSIPELKELYSTYSGNDFEIVSIANDTDHEKWKNVISKNGMSWINVIDPEEEICKKFKISAYPTLMLIGKNGKLVLVNSDKNEVEEYIKSNLGNQSEIINDDPQDQDVNSEDHEVHVAHNPVVKNTHFEGKPSEIQTWRLLSEYSGDGYIILDDFYSAPNEYMGVSLGGDSDFSVWIDGTTEKEIVRSANTVVHETCHGYTSKLYLKMLKEKNQPVKDGNYSAFYLGNRKATLVYHEDVFVTKLINGIFPKNLITDRYETYVYPSEKLMGSQQYGAYGLLDELNAYYWGTKVSFDFYDYYKTKNNSTEGWTDFFNGFYGTYYAYLEFKSYILVYMMYAEQNNKEVYNQILQNKDFLNAFIKIDENWSNLIHAFNSLKKTIASDLNKKGIKMSETNEFIYMGNSGSGNFINIYNAFNSELKKDAYKPLALAMGLKNAGGPEIELLKE